MGISKSYSDLLGRLADNNIGAIRAADLRAIVDTLKMSSVIEAFDPGPAGSGVAIDLGDFDNSTLGSLTDMDEPPAYTWLRPPVIGSDMEGATYVSQVDGDFVVSSDLAGYTFAPPDGSLPQLCELTVTLNAEATGASMLGAVVVYVTKNATFPGDTYRSYVIPFDTGEEAGPFYAKDTATVVLEPNDTLRLRLEYYGTHLGAALTPTINDVLVRQLGVVLRTLRPLQPFSGSNFTEPAPDAETRLRIYSSITGKNNGIPLANRNTITV